MQTDILQSTRSLREESCIFARYVGNVNGEVITLSIVITVKPVAVIEDGIAFSESRNLNWSHLLDVEPTTIGYLVLDLTPVHVISSTHEDATIGEVTLQIVVIEESASGTYTVVPCVSRSGNSGSSIAIGYLGSLFALCHLYEAMTVGSHRSIHLRTLTEHLGHGIIILANGLSPLDVGLIIVEHITYLTALEILGGDIGNVTCISTPVIQGIVVVASTFLTGTIVCTRAELHILSHFKVLQLSPIATDGGTVVILLVSTLIDDQTVLHIGTCACPTNKSATVLCGGTVDDHLGKTVGGKEALVYHCCNTCMSGISAQTALNGDIHHTVADGGTLCPRCYTRGILGSGGDVTDNAQILHDSGIVEVAEESTRPIFIREEIHLDGVPHTIECTCKLVGITANLGLLGTIVDVSRKLSIGLGLTTIYKFSKGLQVLSCPNLIGTVLFVKCPCRGAHDCQYSHQAQTKKSFTHK